jgi:four helix bundle protein
LACKIFANFPFELKKVAVNGIDAAHSISRNISEGYCRRSLKEYLNYLNFALGSCGEFHSCYVSFKQSDQIPKPFILIQNLFVFDHYSTIPLFHYSMCMAYQYNAIKSYLISKSCTLSERSNNKKE